VVWKPSHKVPLCAVAVQKICDRVMREYDCAGVFNLVMGSVSEVGEPMLKDSRLPLISATGSTRMGKRIAEVVGPRLGRTILELGGNNAVVVMDDADLDLAVRAVTFAAVGTAGQRCTTTRRLIVHESIYTEFVRLLVSAFEQVRIGDPLDPKTLMGPLIDARAVESYESAVAAAKKHGGRTLCGGERSSGTVPAGGLYVAPCIVEADNTWPVVQQETFAPILYAMKYRSIEEAIALQNGVRQGLSSAIFTNDVREAELFASACGSDCGIANVNMGTSGAEIGGAFGGEKETGGGRESGSDAWKNYMRRQTVTVNYSQELPLAQGIRFGE